jgi:hypothetical protein
VPEIMRDRLVQNKSEQTGALVCPTLVFAAQEVVPGQVVIDHPAHTVAELQQQIHADLRAQHPEWIGPDGESPMCDFYEARLNQLLSDFRFQTSDV